MLENNSLFISCPKGLEYILRDELQEIGAQISKVNPSGVAIYADQTALIRVCLWSRIANRVLLSLGQTRQADRGGVYDLAAGIDWRNYLNAGEHYWIQAFGQQGNIKHSKFAAQVVKDAINDQFREFSLLPPVIDRALAKQTLQLSISQKITLSLDVCGRSLHQRGYRLEGEQAPLKENLAAALLFRSGWAHQTVEAETDSRQHKITQGVLIDPMCGSGTLVIEAAMMAMDIAPGLLNPDFSLLNAPWFDEELWVNELSRAQQRAVLGKRRWRGSLSGSDSNPQAIRSAKRNAARAGLDRWLDFHQDDATALQVACTSSVNPGAEGPENHSADRPSAGKRLLICNPPYGERLGQELELRALYQHFGQQLKNKFAGWQASVFTGNKYLARELGLQVKKEYKFFNGSLPASLFIYDIYDNGEADRSPQDKPGDGDERRRIFSKQAQMFANRLAKNCKRLERWIKREQLQAYRLYDADLPEYAVAIDCYRENVCIQEYAAPKTIDADKAQQRLLDVLEVVSEVLGVPQQQIFLKQRRKQKGSAQYQRLRQLHKQTVVEEYGCRFRVNLSDYLDTGLFLDHRPIRRYLQENAGGKKFLNLFCYTATASVHAAKGGAVATTNIDLSNTYLNWAKDNFRLNHLLDTNPELAQDHLVKGAKKARKKPFSQAHGTNNGSPHRFEKCDVLRWLDHESGRFDIIFLDPPTFSNSKKLQASLDIQRDHPRLINAAMQRLEAGGLLIFSTNYKRFKLDEQVANQYEVVDKTAFSLPQDFSRKRTHHCWFIKLRG